MKAALLMNDLPIIDSVEQPIGGMERELMSIGVILAERYDTTLYLNTTRPWAYNGLEFRPFNEKIMPVDIAVNCDVPSKKRIVYWFHDRGTIPVDIDLVITDTKRGVEKYKQDGYHTVLFYPPTSIGGENVLRDPQKILFVGAINVGKRVDLAIEAVNLLPEYELHVIGMERGKEAEWCGRYVKDYQRYCKAISKNNIIWRGPLPYSKVIKEMQTAQMIIIPYCSDEEYNTDVALEAISNGCVPLIAEGLTDYFGENEAVFLTNQRQLNPEIIAEAIVSLSEDELKSRQGKCYQKAEEIYRYCITDMKNIICEI